MGRAASRRRGNRGWPCALALAGYASLAVGCATIEGTGDSDPVDAGAGADASPSSPADAGTAPDAPPAQLPPCVEGDRQDEDGDGGCYLLFESPVPWLTARMQCLAIGADLARVDSEEENDRVFELAAGLVDVWVGGNDILVEDRWVWLDDSQEILPPLYSRWRDGEPNDGGDGGEDCMILEVGKGEKEWDDRNCVTRSYPFLCERR